MRNFRYSVARFLIHLGIAIMPEGRYKTEMLDALWDLFWKVQDTLDAEKAKNEETTV